MTMPPDEKPTVNKSTSAALGETYETHPAYGQISVSRQSHTPGAHLYGSDFEHPNVVVLRVSESQLNRTLNRDWPFARKEILEVMLSEAQWASFVSSFNAGAGVQCTINFREGAGYVPGLPAPERTALFKAEANEELAAVKAELAELRAKLGAGTSGLSAKRAEELLGHVKRAERVVGDSLPFLEKQFGRHMENTVEAAKAEVHGYIAARINEAGLAALAQPEQVLALESPPAEPEKGGHP